MILRETIFVAGQPVGVVCQDDYSGEVAFTPIKGKSRLLEREWTSVDEIKAAVIREYENGLSQQPAD